MLRPEAKRYVPSASAGAIKGGVWMFGYRQARSRIMADKFSPVYLLFGEEPFLKEELIALLKERYLGGQSTYGYEKLEAGSVSLPEALTRLQAPSLFASRKLLVLDGFSGPAAANAISSGKPGGSTRGKGKNTGDGGWEQQLFNFLEREKAGIPGAILVLLAATVDRRRRWFKQLDKRAIVVECTPLRGGELAGWIREQVGEVGKTIEREALELILLEGENNLWHIYNELQKYITFLGDKEPVITPEVIEELQAIDSPANIFKLTDSLAEGDGKTALGLLNRLLRHREPPLKIFFMFTRHFRLLLETCALLEMGTPPRQLAGELKVPPFVSQKLYRQASLYSRETLEDIILELHDCDFKIKTGQVEPALALEVILGWISSFHRSPKVAGV